MAESIAKENQAGVWSRQDGEIAENNNSSGISEQYYVISAIGAIVLIVIAVIIRKLKK